MFWFGPDHFHDLPEPKGRKPKYRVRHLAVGQTAYFPGVTGKRVGDSIRQCAPMKFECKTVVKRGIKQAKITRIK